LPAAKIEASFALPNKKDIILNYIFEKTEQE
jgi:hypothetical protein